MKCFHCQGELRRGNTTYTINRHGYHIIIDDVPAWICSQCGEPLFEAREADVIQRALAALDRESQKLAPAS